MFLLTLLFGKILAKLISIISPSRGSNFSGKIVIKLCPNFLKKVKGINRDKIIFITGTNGKSTSTNLIAHAFKSAGNKVATNGEGANLKTGIITTLIKNTSLLGKFNKEYLILEVDERSLFDVQSELNSKIICITNIQKDQVQRNGDPDYIYQKIKKSISDDVFLFVNNDEPRSLSLKENCKGHITYGVKGGLITSNKEDFFGVSMPCPICHEALDFDNYNICNVGKFSCHSCGFKSNENPDYQIENVDKENRVFTINGEQFYLKYEASHFLYNYALCVAVLKTFNIDSEKISEALKTFVNVGGRLDKITYKNKTITYLRIKQENPETLQNCLDYIKTDEKKKVLLIELEKVHDIIPEYSNTFYAYDCNFEILKNNNIEKFLCFGDEVCYDLYNRLSYAGIDSKKMVVIETDDNDLILQKLIECDSDEAYLVAPLKRYDDIKKKVGNE